MRRSGSETADGNASVGLAPSGRLMRGGLHSCHARGDFLSARGVPTYIILDRLGQGSADVTSLPHVRERDRTIKRSTRMELSSKSRMHLMGPRDTRLALFSLLSRHSLSFFLSLHARFAFVV